VSREVAEQATFYFAGSGGALFPISPGSIEAAKQLRDSAIALRDRVSTGGYENPDVADFWKILEAAPSVLLAKPEVLSAKAGLGPAYFVSVVKERRYPKLHNFLKAISAVIDLADQRLSEMEPSSQIVRVGWKPNPLASSPARADQLQRQLVDLVRSLKASNALSDVPELDAYWRKTLIALLETVIAVLKAPLAEPSLLKRAVTGLRGFAKGAAGTAGKEFVGQLAEDAAHNLGDLLSEIG
jgi:hypothetical protein